MLSDEEALQLARWACSIGSHYHLPVDIEWAKEGETGELFVVQARPETVYSQKKTAVLKTCGLKSGGKRSLLRARLV